MEADYELRRVHGVRQKAVLCCCRGPENITIGYRRERGNFCYICMAVCIWGHICSKEIVEEQKLDIQTFASAY